MTELPPPIRHEGSDDFVDPIPPSEDSEARRAEVSDDAGEVAVGENVEVDEVGTDEASGDAGGDGSGEPPEKPPEVPPERPTGDDGDPETPDDDVFEPVSGILKKDLREVKIVNKIIPAKDDKGDKKTYYRIEGSSRRIPSDAVVLESSPGYKYWSHGIKIERPEGGKIGRGGRRHFGGYEASGDGTYKFVYDVDRIADRIGVPRDVLEAAAAKGITPEFLVRAKDNHHSAEYLKSQGIKWGKDSPPTTALAGREVSLEELRKFAEDTGVEVTADYVDFARAEAERDNLRPADYLKGLGLDLGFDRLDPPDPVILIGEIGRRRRAGATEIIKEIEDDAGEVRKKLKRPGRLPFLLHKVPVAGPAAAKRILAFRIARKAKHDMPREVKKLQSDLEALQRLGVRNETDQEEMEKLPKLIKEKQDEYNRAGLRWYIKKYQRYHNYLDTLDGSVKSHRKRLHAFDRSLLFDESGATDRRNLAYRIFDTRISLEQLKDLKIIDMNNPEFVHNHEAFKIARKKLQRSRKNTKEDMV